LTAGINESIRSNEVKPYIKLTRMAALLLTLLPLMFGCGGKEERMAAHMEKGKAYYEQANYDKAKVELKNVLQIDPKSADAYYLLGLIEEEQQNWQSAFADYSKAVELNPDQTQAKAKLGRLYIFSGAVDEADNIANEILARNPGDLAARFLKAAVMTRKGDVSGAIQETSQIVAADAAQFDAVSLLGGLYVMQGEDAKAQAILEKGVKASPKNIPLHMDLASLLVRRNEFDKAEEVFKEVVAVDPSKLAYRANLVSFYTRTNQLDKAEKALRDAIAADPEDLQRHLLLVEFLATKKTPEQAEKELLSAIEGKPKAYPLRFSLARLYELTGKPAQAEQTYRDIIGLAKTGPEGLKARVLLARTKLATGNAADAEKLLAEVLTENPGDSDALRLRAQMSLAKSDATKSIADLRVVLKDHPDSIEVITLLASAHMANNEPQLAKNAFINAIVRYPNNSNLRVALAEFLAAGKDYDGALKELDTALNADPQNASAYQVKADVQIDRNDWRAAEETLTRLKAVLPSQPVGYYRLGWLYLNQKKYDQAIAEFEVALRKAPDALDPLTAIVTAHLEQGKPDKAVARINKAIQAAPGNPTAYYSLLANVYAREKKYTEAETALRQATQSNQKAPGPYVGLANLYAMRGDTKGAVDVLQQGLGASPGDPLPLSFALAVTYERAGDKDKAIAEYEKILQKNPGSDAAANNLAVLLSEVHGNKANLDRALALAKRFENSSNPSFLDTLGWVYFRLGENERALPLLQKAVAMAPNAPARQYHLGMALFKQGDMKSARTHLKLAVDSKMNFPGIEDANGILAKM
jgi:tetratricopeptide (TPR) repeat protein